MSERFKYDIKSSVLGTFERVGENVGVIAAEQSFDNEGNLRGFSISLSTGKIDQDVVTIVDEVFQDLDNADHYEHVRGAVQPHVGYAWFDVDGKQQDWHGLGFSAHGYSVSPGWPSFQIDRLGEKKKLSEGVWAVGDDIMRNVKEQIETVAPSQEVALKAYGAFYVRTNRLIVDSYRRQLKEDKVRPAPLTDMLLIDANMTVEMQRELELASHYEEFTRNHLRLNTETKAFVQEHARDGYPSVADRFAAVRAGLAEDYKIAVERAEEMYDSIHVPSGFRIGSGRTWPFMDIGNEDFEVRQLRERNTSHVLQELDRESKELDYKLRELIAPHKLVLKALSGLHHITVYN